jgi:hypothetical protein
MSLGLFVWLWFSVIPHLPPTMADIVATKKTSLASEEVIVRAIQYFSSVQWRPSSQSARAVSFDGKIPIPWGSIVVTILGFILCIVPGVICYIMLIRKVHRFVNLVVTANPVLDGTDVIISHPKSAGKAVYRFFTALPDVGPPIISNS